MAFFLEDDHKKPQTFPFDTDIYIVSEENDTVFNFFSTVPKQRSTTVDCRDTCSDFCDTYNCRKATHSCLWSLPLGTPPLSYEHTLIELNKVSHTSDYEAQNALNCIGELLAIKPTL